MVTKRLLELGSLTLGVVLFAAFAGCDDSSSDNGPTGGAMNTNAGGMIGGGGVPVTGGGVPGGGVAGAAPPGGGATGDPLACGSNLLPGGLGTSTNWIGGDNTVATDNPCGIQGAFYAYGDWTTPGDTSTALSCPGFADPIDCSSGSCTITGRTISDADYAAWGCGIGLSLQDSGGTTSVKSPYSGPAIGFQVTVSGTFTQELRIGYTALADTAGKVSPFVNGGGGASTIPGPGVYTVYFADAECPSWAEASHGCQVTSAPYDLQFQICGGGPDHVGSDFALTISEVTPVTS